MGMIVHKTVHASTMGPATVLPAPVAVLLDTTATPVNTVCTTLTYCTKIILLIRLLLVLLTL